jgi:hypothetical protein
MREFDIRQRLLIIIGVIIGLLVLLFLSIYLLRPRADAPADVSLADSDTGTVSDVPAVPIYRPPTAVAPAVLYPPIGDAGELYVTQLARIFTERFLSYSNQNDNTHIDIAMSMATDRVASWIATQARDTALEYEGVSTNVLTTRLVSYDGVISTVYVDLSSTYSGSRSDTEIRSARVELTKEGDEWKIDGFYLDPTLGL